MEPKLQVANHNSSIYNWMYNPQNLSSTFLLILNKKFKLFMNISIFQISISTQFCRDFLCLFYYPTYIKLPLNSTEFSWFSFISSFQKNHKNVCNSFNMKMKTKISMVFHNFLKRQFLRWNFCHCIDQTSDLQIWIIAISPFLVNCLLWDTSF